jgi:hypothetical protein
MASTHYDNLQLNPLTLVSTVPVNTTPHYIKVPITPKSAITYNDPSYPYTNVIPNPSFTSGLWQKKVGDCNAYDNSPVLGMKLDTNTPSRGVNALELDATSHIACTGPPPIKVGANTKLSFSFDYQSPNGSSAGYSVSFNNSMHSSYGHQLAISDTKWHNYSTLISVPDDATTLSLTVYSYSNNPSNKSIVTRYSNFKLMSIPDLVGSYYLVNQAPQTLVTPQHVSFNKVNSTKTLVKVTGASTPFYVNMSEAYDANWRLEMNDSKLHGSGSWLPTAKPNIVLASNHYKLNDFANGWYVDVDQLCRQQNLCSHNVDGSYNLSMEVEYTTQRWFYVGLVMSAATLATCLAYLLYTNYLERKRKVYHTR